MSTIAATEFLPLVATAGAAADSLVVSLHDVAPPTQQITTTIISELGRHGVRVCSILVVPDYHHQGFFARHREFVTWLRGVGSRRARNRDPRLFSRTSASSREKVCTTNC